MFQFILNDPFAQEESMRTKTSFPDSERTGQAAWILTALGVVHIPLIAFHLAFPTLFQWGTELSVLAPDNRNLLWAMHLCGIFWLGSMGAATLMEGWRRRTGLDEAMPRAFWIWVAGFWLFRIGIQIPIEGLGPQSLAMVALLLPFPALYLVAWKKLGPETFETRGFVGARLRPESWLR